MAKAAPNPGDTERIALLLVSGGALTILGIRARKRKTAE
jgi:hypothetical protein